MASFVSSLKEGVSKTLNNSKVFNSTVDYLNDKRNIIRAEQALKDAQQKLNILFDELGRATYFKKPVNPGRTSTVVRAEIAALLETINQLQKDYDEMTSSQTVPTEQPKQTSETSDNTKTE